MIKFAMQHKLLVLFLFLSIATIGYSFCCSDFEKSPIAILLVQIAVGYVVNFIFYITLSFIPEKRKLETTRKIIARRLNHMIGQMRNFPDAIIKQFSPDEHENRKVRLKKASENLNTRWQLDSAGLCLSNSGKYVKWTVGDFLYTKTLRVEEELDRILRYYSYAVTPELDELFDKILHTGVHTSFKMWHKHNSPFVNASDEFVKYDELADELEKVQQLYE